MVACGSGDGGASDVEDKHGVDLPESAADFETVGDPGLLETIDIDRGYTSVFTMAEEDLQPFLDSLPSDSTNYSGSDWHGWPGNTQYQPSSLPWDEGATELVAEVRNSPAGGDFMSVQAYEIDGDRVAVALYSDWN